MAKDRSRPFSKKHRKYWIPVTGGMVLIGVVNVILGYCTYPEQSTEEPQQIELHVPKPWMLRDAGVSDATTAPVR